MQNKKSVTLIEHNEINHKALDLYIHVFQIWQRGVYIQTVNSYLAIINKFLFDDVQNKKRKFKLCPMGYRTAL